MTSTAPDAMLSVSSGASDSGGAADSGGSPDFEVPPGSGGAVDSSDTADVPDGARRASVADLPAPVRARLIGWAAKVLGTLPPPQVPAALTRVARFAPAKRARSAGPALILALDQDPAFRAAVAQAAPHRSADPVDAAAAAALTDHTDLDRLLDEVRSGTDALAVRGEIEQARAEIARLRKALSAQESLGAPAVPEDDAQLARLRKRLRDQGVRLRESELAAVDAERRFTAEVSRLSADLERSRSQLEQAQTKAQAESERADRAQETVARLRAEGQAARAHDDRRLDLLLSTVEGAMSGLRRELELTGGGSSPAETVAAGLSVVPGRSEGTDDPRRLQAWLNLPGAHLIVDGYNVSKSGFGEMTLLDQRDRLTRLLSGLAVRTSAEVTVVFDGAAVVAPLQSRRGVRVLFSPPGVLADDVIADLAAAEPVGRVLVVVTSDADVVRRVRRSRARTAPSTVLLTLLRS